MSSTETDHDDAWSALHAYLPMSLQTAFLREVIRPAVQDAGVQDRFFFLRYWQGGPHIRLRLHRASGPTVESVRRALSAAMPALTAEQAAEYEQQASLQPGLAGLEGAEPIDTRPPGTVEPTRYSPEYAKYGGTSGILIAEQLFRSTSAAVLDLLAARPAAGPDASTGLAVRIMAMSLRGSGLDLERSRDFLATYEQEWRRWVPPGYDDRWADVYERTRPQVTSLCRAVWLDGTTDAFHDIYAAASAAARTAQGDPTRRDPREFELEGTPYLHCVANYVHTTNNRLGVLPVAEAFLAHVVGRSLDEVRSCATDGSSPFGSTAAVGAEQ